MKREEGFVLLEVLVAGLALLAMSACFLLYARSAEVRAADSCRVRAVFLARTQFAAAQAAADRSRLSAGSYPWQGEAGDLQGGEVAYRVETEVVKEREDIFKVMVEVTWQGETGGALKLEREVVAHGS